MNEGARKRDKPFFSYTQALVEFLLFIIGAFLLAWLNLPSYVYWIIIALFVLTIIAARVFRR